MLNGSDSGANNGNYQIWLMSDGTQSYCVFQFTSIAVSSGTLGAKSGLEQLITGGTYRLISISNPVTSSNVGSTGIWVYETTTSVAGKMASEVEHFLVRIPEKSNFTKS